MGPHGVVPFVDLFPGRDELVVCKHMWYDGAPHQGQCEGCTVIAWQLKDAAYLNVRGVSLAILTTAPWDEVSRYVEFMGYTQPWYSVRDVPAPVGDDMGSIACYLREGERVFLTDTTTDRGSESVSGSFALLDMTPYGRGETWEDHPEDQREIGDVGDGHPSVGHRACWYWRSDADGNAISGPTSRPVPQWTRPGASAVESLGRNRHHH